MIDVYHKLIEMAQKPDLTPDEQFALGYATGRIWRDEWTRTVQLNPETKDFEPVYPEPGRRIEMLVMEKSIKAYFGWMRKDNAFLISSGFDGAFILDCVPTYWRYLSFPEDM